MHGPSGIGTPARPPLDEDGLQTNSKWSWRTSFYCIIFMLVFKVVIFVAMPCYHFALFVSPENTTDASSP
jgi:hypothetical protein